MKKRSLFVLCSILSAAAIVGTVALAGNSVLDSENYATEQEYSITLNESYWKSRGLSGQVGDITQQTASGYNIGFSANSFVEYTPDGWGSFAQNGYHWDANIKTTTAITGIKKVYLHCWFNISGSDETGKDPYVNLITASDADFTTDVTKTRLYKSEGGACGLGCDFTVQTYDSPSYVKIDWGDDSNNTFLTSIMNLTITYSCSTPDNKISNLVKEVNKTYSATAMDGGNAWGNGNASYKFFGVYDKAAIVSCNMTLIEHEYRAYHGLVVTDGSKIDATKGYETPRNYKSYQVGLATKGGYSCCNLCNERARDHSNAAYFSEYAVGTSAKLTIVLKSDKLYIYINDVYYNTKTLTAVDPCGGFTAGSNYMFGVWFHNYCNTNRTISLVDEIYGETAVNAEIASNAVYANLR